MATFEDYLFVKNSKWIFWGIGALVTLLLVFRAGVVVGFHEALSSHGLGRRPPQSEPFGLSLFGGTIPGHGAVGSIATVTLPTLIIQTRDGMMEKIGITSATAINDENGQPLAPSELKAGDMVIIIGEPGNTGDMNSEGEIDARLIRVLPPPPAGLELPGGAPTTSMNIIYRAQQ
ncbi:MAG: hypothetical protein KGH79_00400 [Patescibacteria group bacterium]|nr:hypothetical protein [Patescibacteria group bacterium]